eukprot:5199605-Alexandrium_andersonii.AAC.1
MFVEAMVLGLSWCVGRNTMADSCPGQVQTPSTEAHWGPLGAASKQVLCYWREGSRRATWDTASQRPKLLCRSH